MKREMTFVAAALLALAPSLAQAETSLRYGDHGANRGTRAASAMWFMDEVEKRTAIKVEQHWGGALVSAKTMRDGLENGVVSIGTLIGSYYPKDFVGWRVGDLPIEVPHELAGAMTMHELLSTNPALISEFERQGLKYLASYSVGPVQMICNTDPITEVEQFDGLKVRFAGAYGDILSKFGAIPVALPVTKSYEALDAGLADCSQAYGYLVMAFKLYEVGKQFVVFDAGTLQSNAIVMNLDAFEALSTEEQNALEQIGTEMTESNARAIRKANQGVVQKLPEGVDGHVVQVSHLSDAAKQKLRDASADAVDKWLAETKNANFDGAALLEAYKALLNKNIEKYADED